jgi:hypothetical protein
MSSLLWGGTVCRSNVCDWYSLAQQESMASSGQDHPSTVPASPRRSAPNAARASPPGRTAFEHERPIPEHARCRETGHAGAQDRIVRFVQRT